MFENLKLLQNQNCIKRLLSFNYNNFRYYKLSKISKRPYILSFRQFFS